MAEDDIPNGFLNLPRRRPGFESAGDAIRKSERRARNGNSIRLPDRDSERRAFQSGWRISSDVEAQDRSSGQTNGRHSRFPISGDRDSQYGKHARIESETVESKKYNTFSWSPVPSIMEYVNLPDPNSGDEGPIFDFDMIKAIPDKDHRWSWIEIDRDAIRRNIYAIRKTLNPSTMFLAVVKSDGYGHGSVESARIALSAGAEYLGVATVDEAIELREAGIDAPILVLSQPPRSTIPALLAYHITPSIYAEPFAIEYARAADAIGMNAPYHLKINTGMNRVGVRYDEVLDLLYKLAPLKSLDLQGTFTHFATADCDDTMEFNLQRQRFEEALSLIRGAGIDPGIIHAANSAATLRYPEVQYDMVRVGLAMYGYYPCDQVRGSIELVPAMGIKARITKINQVPIGEGVSYGLLYRSSGYGVICTIPIGYADGLRRGLSSRIGFIRNGKKYPQVGNICMDQCMFEVETRRRSDMMDDLPQIGDEVIVVGCEGEAAVTIDEMADILNTIPYELMIGFGISRLPRIYK